MEGPRREDHRGQRRVVAAVGSFDVLLRIRVRDDPLDFPGTTDPWAPHDGELLAIEKRNPDELPISMGLRYLDEKYP